MGPYRGGRPPTACLMYIAIYLGSRKISHFQVIVKLVNLTSNRDHIMFKNVYLLKGYAA